MTVSLAAGVGGVSIPDLIILTMKRLSFLILAVVAVAVTLGAKVVKYSSATDPVLAVVVDSVDFRSDLTRVYGKIVGTPHTSGRVDAASLLSGKRSWQGTDIDGVDFKRYFQWEDDGQIPVEIDFPAMKPFKTAQLVLTTVRGESVTTVKRK